MNKRERERERERERDRQTENEKEREGGHKTMMELDMKRDILQCNISIASLCGKY